MGAVLVLSFLFSSRQVEPDGILKDHLFPLIGRAHPPGKGTFPPGSFALGFFGPSLAGMVLLNLSLPGWFRPLRERGANVFYYLLGVVLAILEVAADTLIPVLALGGPWRFRIAVSAVHAGFFGAVALATLFSAGAGREW